MAEFNRDEKRALGMLMRSVQKFVYADGKADIAETKSLIGLVHPFSAKDADIALFEHLLVDIAEDGVVTPEESQELAAAISSRSTRRRTRSTTRGRSGFPGWAFSASSTCSRCSARRSWCRS